MCVYYPTKTTLRNANVDNEERMVILSSYKHCMLARFKEDKKATASKREELKSRLAKSISFLDTDFVNLSSSLMDIYLQHVVFDLSGYMLHSRAKKIGKCEVCWQSILSNDDLDPDDFYADKLVVLKNKGGLKKATPNMFSIFLHVERELMKHFKNGEVLIRDSFEKVMNKIAKLSLHPVGCEQHRKTLVSELIYDYVVIRFRFEAKAIKNKEIQKAKTTRHKNRKLSKLLTTKQVENSKTVSKISKVAVKKGSQTKAATKVRK